MSAHAQVVTLLVIIILQGMYNMANISRLTGAVAHLTVVSSSVIALVQSLASQIRDNVDDPDALNSLADDIENQADALAAAVTANTPVDSSQAGQANTDPAAANTDTTDSTINEAPVPADDNGGDSNGDLPTVGDVVEANESTGDGTAGTTDNNNG